MPLFHEGEEVLTAHASKQSKVSVFKMFEAHTSVLIPFAILPVFPFWITFKIACAAVLILVLLERRGWTVSIAFKKLRSRLAGRYRYRNGKKQMIRRVGRY